jgi:hypothetical protein
MSVAHAPAELYSSQFGANRCQTFTWGAPTNVASPGNSQGNLPTPTTDLNGNVINANNWTALASGDTCTPVYCPALTDKSVQITGTAGAGGSIAIQGSNDGSNWVTLTDVLGNSLAALAPGTISQINQETNWLKAVVNSGDGTTAMNVIVAGKRAF